MSTAKKNIFEDEDVEEEYDVFEKALKKKAFDGQKGHLLMELQTSYKNDGRFMMDNKFKDDLDTRKVSKNVKQMSNAFDEYNKNKSYIYSSHKGVHEKNVEIVNEKNKNMSILSQIIPNNEFLGTVQPKKYSNPKNFLIKRFDPKLKIGQDLVIQKKNSQEVKKEKESDKNIIKLKKGMSNTSEENLLPADKITLLKKRDKEKEIQKTMNELHNQLEPKVEIKFDNWKSIVSGKDSQVDGNLAFSLFDGYVAKSENDKAKEKNKVKEVSKEINVNQKNEPKEFAFKLFEDTDNKLSQDQKEKNEKMLLKKKRKQEKKKLKEKLKKDEQKLAEKNKDEKVEKKLKTNLLKEFDDEKVDNYMRYVNLIREKKSNNK
jgi:hypothetical protein